MIVNNSPEAKHVGESFSTLQFASTLKGARRFEIQKNGMNKKSTKSVSYDNIDEITSKNLTNHKQCKSVNIYQLNEVYSFFFFSFIKSNK